MSRIKLSLEDIRHISLFENVTRAKVKDCIVKKNKIIFIVGEGQAGIAIGKAGSNIKKLEKKLNKKIQVLEYSDNPSKFVANIFRPVRIKNAYVSEKSTGEKILHISLSKGNLGMIKSKMKKAKKYLDKYFNFDEVVFD